MTTFVTQSNLRKRLGITNRTFRARISAAGIEPDAVLLERSKQGAAQALFSVEKLPALRLALTVALRVKRPAQIIQTIA